MSWVNPTCFRYILPQLYGGLNNQKRAAWQALLLANRTNRILLLPLPRARPHRHALGLGPVLSFSEVFNSKRFCDEVRYLDSFLLALMLLKENEIQLVIVSHQKWRPVISQNSKLLFGRYTRAVLNPDFHGAKPMITQLYNPKPNDSLDPSSDSILHDFSQCV